MKEFQNIRTGVIGVGSMGQNHARIYDKISNLVGVSDYDKNQGNEIAKRFGVPFFENYEDMLHDVDAVSVAVPTVIHHDVCVKVANSSTHFLVEKPLSDNFSRASQIVEAASNNSVTMAVGHIERHNPVVRFAKKCIENQEWGQIITMSSQRVSKYPYRIKDVGVILDLASHDIDVIRYLSQSNVNEIFAIGGRMENSKKEDHSSILLNFENGINGYCEVSWLTPMRVRKLTITCTKAYVVLDFANQEIQASKSNLLNVNNQDLSKIDQEIETIPYEISKAEPLELELIDFLNAVKYSKKPLVTGEEGLENVRLAEQALQYINKLK